MSIDTTRRKARVESVDPKTGYPRLISGEYSGGMYMDVGFAGRYPIEVIEVKPNEAMRRRWEKMSRKEQTAAMLARIVEWTDYMDDPNDDGNWDGWYQDYVDASRPNE